MDHDRDHEAMEELVRGREFANKLGQVLAVMKNNHNHDDELAAAAPAAATPLFAQHLVNNILNSFTNTLFLLKNNHMQLKRDFSFISPTKSEDNTQDTSNGAAGRGSYKTRKTRETWEKISESPIDDGHQWRKYGQKTILNSKYSREYYRCSHKLDQRCEATKQVQRVEEKPVSYKTTYYGHHSCKNTHDEIIFEPTSPHSHTNSSSILLSFNNAFPTPKDQDCPFLSSHNNNNSVLDCKEEEVVIPSPSEDEFSFYPLNSTISTLSSSSTKLESDDDHKDMMMIMYGLLYDSVDQLDHRDHFFHPFLGLL